MPIGALSFDQIPFVDAAPIAPLRRKRRAPSWFEYLPQDNAIYFQFNACPASETDTIGEQLPEAIDKLGLQKLVIDLRDNTGGDFTRFWGTLAGIKQRPQIDRRGGLFVLAGPKTFSAAMVNALELRQRTKALLIGEPTGARPNGYGENRYLNLANSGLTVSYSTRHYSLVEGHPPGVEPDLPAPPTLEADLAGRDLTLEAALNDRE